MQTPSTHAIAAPNQRNTHRCRGTSSHQHSERWGNMHSQLVQASHLADTLRQGAAQARRLQPTARAPTQSACRHPAPMPSQPQTPKTICRCRGTSSHKHAERWGNMHSQLIQPSHLADTLRQGAAQARRVQLPDRAPTQSACRHPATHAIAAPNQRNTHRCRETSSHKHAERWGNMHSQPCQLHLADTLRQGAAQARRVQLPARAPTQSACRHPAPMPSQPQTRETPTVAEEHQATNTQRDGATCTHNWFRLAISLTLSGKVPLRLVECNFLPALRHNQHADTQHPCHRSPKPRKPFAAAEEHQATNTQRDGATCTHNSCSLVISPTLSGKVPLRLVEYSNLPALRHNQHADT
eukprot:COSAG02_NODE_133_length_34692_cov_83.845229_3_plen_353_part_00